MTDVAASFTRPGRGLNIVLWVLQALLAAAFLAAGGSKLAGVPQLVALFDQIGLGQWFRYFVGFLEVICAVGLLIPRLTAYAAAVLACVMACATGTHLAVIGGNPAPAIVLALLSGFVAYRRWSSAPRPATLSPVTP